MLAGLFSAPRFPDEARTRRARLFHVTSLAIAGIATGVLLPLSLIETGLYVPAIRSAVVVDVLCAILMAVNRTGRTRLAGAALVCGLIALVSFNAWNAGGIRSPGMQSYLVFPLLAGILLGFRAGMATAIACGALSMALVIAETKGRLPPPAYVYGPTALWALNLIYAGISLFLLRLATSAVVDALRRAEAELAERRRTEQQLGMALDAGLMGVWEHAQEGNRFHADSRAFGIFGLPLPPDHAMSMETWLSMIHPDDRRKPQDALHAILSGASRGQARYRIRRPDGGERHLEAAGMTRYDEAGRPLRVVGVVADVTERVLLEAERERLILDLGERVKELRLLHATARLLQSARPFSRDILEKLVATLPAAWKHASICEARIAYRDLDIRTPGWRETPWRQSAPFSTSGGKGVVEVAYLEERPPEAEGPFLVEERAMLSSLVEMLVAYLDREQEEGRRRAAEAQLRQAQKMEALGTLAGGVAHDFNNILAAMGGYLDLATADLAPEHASRVHLQEIQRAYGRARDLVKRILLFSRRQDAERKVIALGPVVEEVLKLLRASLPPTIAIRSELGAGLPPVCADASQFHQVLMNLGTNAGHAMAQKGGTLAVTLDRHAQLETHDASALELAPGDYLRVAVSDTGSGMSPEILQRLFEPFFTTKGQGGTGLGLSVVHGIVRDHGGAITVDSAVGRGTTFRVYVPAVRAPAAATSQAPPPVVLGTGQRVLLLDDDETLVFLMKRILERLGYRCVGFSDGHAAIQAFRSEPGSFDAVLTDMSMPRMSGLEFAGACRQIRSEIPILICSGGGDSATDSPDITARLAKPVSMGDLGRALHALFR